MDRSAEFAKSLVAEKKDFVVAHVAEAQVSSPGKKGAWLVMARDGQWTGTVGGNSLEAEAQRIAREAFDIKEPFVKEGAVSPEEIAVSIGSELIGARKALEEAK